MVNISHGMNVDEVEGLGRRLQGPCVGNVREVVQQIEAMVNGTSATWVGPDADRFRRWWPAKRNKMLAMAEDLHGFGQSALNNVAEQRQASGTGNDSSGGGDGIRGGGIGPITIPEPPIGGGAGEVQQPRTWQDVQKKYDAWAAKQTWSGWSDPSRSQYQCTGWANFRWNELGYNGIVGGDGGQMASKAPGDVSDTPTLHAMGSYQAGAKGHVMIVEEISADGSKVRVSEMNVGGNGWRTANPDEYRDKRWLAKGSDGRFYYDGIPVHFAEFPG